MCLYSNPSTHGISELAAGRTIKWTQRYTPRPWSSQFGDALGVLDAVNLEVVIERVWRYTWMLRSCELGGRIRASLVIHLEGVMEWVSGYTCRLWWSEFGDSLGGRDRARLDEYLEAVDRRCAGCWDCIGQLVDLQRWECDKRWPYLWALPQSWLMAVDCIGRHAGSWSYIEGSTCNHEIEGMKNNLGRMPYWVYTVLGVCCGRSMLYSVSTHDHSMER